jgi:hypothetical protein
VWCILRWSQILYSWHYYECTVVLIMSIDGIYSFSDSLKLPQDYTETCGTQIFNAAHTNIAHISIYGETSNEGLRSQILPGC